MGLARIVLPAALLLAALPVPPSQAAPAKCPSSTGRFAVWGAGVVADRKTPTARLMEERWLPDGRVEGLIMERLGHQSISMTMNTYGHLFPGDSHRTSEALDRVFQQSDKH